ncbi:phosphodiester glycosidase family protein [Paenibacillus hemerocallicola]|uniref:Phosphodiester glycosidase family protein n=1 Tax=Paenibacillus hemerocallicola TaxID=1172614 RepID=A0A5C4T3A2_9BACL|nr:phosphodiester glycosidase family protein [Paenibacillus hemerocallicola]TNJ63511.1 phosphodiester glycosidase family protein [Paenibacillus hemerocallicola]
MTAREINRFFLLSCAPFVGMLVWLLSASFTLDMPKLDFSPALHLFSITEEANTVQQNLEKASGSAVATKSTIEKFYQLYEQSATDTSNMLKLATAQAARPSLIFDSRISAEFGKPTRTVASANIDLKLYQFNDANYKGYALKVDMKSDKAMKMALGKDKIGSSETTLAAASRYGAVAGINAGGFADTPDGKRYPLSTTVLDGKYVYGFESTFDNLAFVGLSADRKLIGGKFARQADLDKLKPSFGATFVPILLKGGVKQQIPSQWLNSPKRAPRTVVGNFGNDQLLFIVADGYDERGGSGATLTELQDKLAKLRVVDAYNLDGGGSTSLVFEGRTVNNPSDGRLRPLPTNFLFFK